MAINKYQIIANGIELDTNEEIDISLNYQIENIMDISKRNTNYSKTISLPGTPINNNFFKHNYEVTIDNNSYNYNPNKKIAAIIRVGDSQVFTGFMRIANIYINNKEITYDINFTGILKDILTEIEDYTLRDLNLSKYDHYRTSPNISNSWNYIVKEFGTDAYRPLEGAGYVYPYIVNGNSQDIWYTSYIYDLFPAPYVKTIVDALFDFAGFTYTSKFINSEYFKKLIMPYTGDKLQMSSEEFEERSVRAGVPGPSTSYIQFSPTQSRGSDWYKNDTNSYKLEYQGGGFTRESGQVNDNGADLDFTDQLGQWTNDVFTCNKTGRYNVRFDGKLILKVTHDNNKDDMEFKEGNFEYFYQMYLFKAAGGSMIIDSSVDPNDPNDVYGVQLFQPSDGTHPSPWYDIDTPLLCAMSADDLFLESGDKIRVRIGFRYPQAVKWQGTSDNKHRCSLQFKQSYDGAFSKFVVEPASNESLGNEYINLSQTLPDKLKMKDFFLDIIKMFNLIVMDNPDKENDLLIEPRDDFFRSKQRVLDWNHLLDNDSTIKQTPMSELDAKRYLYTYKEDEDVFNKEYKDEYDKVYGEYFIDVENDFSTNVNKTEVLFAATPISQRWVYDRPCAFFAEKDDEELKPKKVKPRILFYGGLIGSTILQIKDFPGQASFPTYYQFPYAGMWDNPYSPSYSLEFGPSMQHYWYTTQISKNTLFERFHKATLQNITDVNSRLLEATFYLTPKDIAQFDFRDIIFLMGAYWRVSKIKDYNPAGADSLTKVVLYKINNLEIIEPFVVNVPVSNQRCPDDMVSKIVKGKKGTQYINVSQSGLPVTEDCCTSFGGRFIGGVCYSYPTLPSLPGLDGGIKPHLDGIIGTVKPSGPSTLDTNNNTIGRLGVKVSGSGNYVSPESQGGMILGNNSTIQKNVKDTIVIGDGITAIESGAIYIGDIKIGQDGNITTSGIVIIDGGEDAVFPFDKTNLIDVIDGGFDSLRNPGGDSKARPIIDGGTPE